MKAASGKLNIKPVGLPALKDAILEFDKLPLCDATKKAITEGLGFKEMTPVQALSLPHSLKGSDVLAQAKTGTGKLPQCCAQLVGKTLSFLVPILEMLQRKEMEDREGKISAIILCPVRELASQIFEEAKRLLKFHEEVKVILCIGGDKVRWCAQ
jgi:ATP-dependent RNA helicase DeaD